MPKSSVGPPGLWLAVRIIAPYALRSRTMAEMHGVEAMKLRPTMLGEARRRGGEREGERERETEKKKEEVCQRSRVIVDNKLVFAYIRDLVTVAIAATGAVIRTRQRW